MRSVILMCNPARFGVLVFIVLGICNTGSAQVNSPFSRFGIGDLYSSRNVSSKAMGGLAVPFKDVQAVNFVNPATYAGIGFVTFDVGVEAEYRAFVNKEKTDRYESGNLIFNYVAMGVPLAKNKKTGNSVWGMAFGLRPYSRIRYNISSPGRIPNIDSTIDEFKGNGGLYNGFLGTGVRIGGLSLGINVGYIFGQKELGSYRTPINDTVFYYTGSITQRTSITKFAADAGLQYEIKTSKNSLLRIGATGYLGGDAKGERERLAQTVFYNSSGAIDSIDVVLRDKTKGVYTLPAGYSLGLAYEKRNKMMIGAEYETSKWSELTNFGQPAGMGDVEMFRLGGYVIPDAMTPRNYFKQVAYRAGVFTGKDYVMVDGKQLPVWGFSIGGSFPVKRYSMYSTQYNTIHLSFEYGRRGNTENPYFERYFKVNFGLSLSDIWFIKRQYD